MADKKRFLDKDYTRRQFLKLSGKSLAGLALSTSMLSAMGVTEKAVAEDKVRVWAFPQGLLVVDASVAQPASNSGCRPTCRCPAQSETSATYDILSAFASQQPHHAQQDWRLFPFKQGSSKFRSVICPSIILIGRGFKPQKTDKQCAPLSFNVQGQSLLVRCFHFLGAIRLSPLPLLLPFYLSPMIPRSAFLAIIKSAGSRLIQLEIIEPWISAKIACALGTLSSSEKPNRTR